MNLNNKVAWITGGARMGVVVAGVLSQRGCRIVLTYRQSKKAAADAVRQLVSTGGTAVALRCDLARRRQMASTAKQIVRRFGRLDVLVNLASIYEKSSVSNPAPAEKSWNEHLQANAQSAYNLSVAAAPHMNKSGGGRIVHIADWTSASGRPRYKGFTPYYVSKAAIQAVVEALALELAPVILVNAIAPGPILPPAGLTAREHAAVVRSTPLARWGGAEEIAKAVLFLVETDFVTGETIRVDGGRHLY